MKSVVECLWCGTEFERSRRWGYFCETCRVKRDRTLAAERMQARRDELAEAADTLRKSLAEDYIPSIDEFLSTLELGEGEEVGLVHDRMPDGANSPYGPDEGRSTYFADLAADLDYLCKTIAKHDWWNENPHWAFELHDKEEAAKYFAEVKRAREAEPDGCRDAKGTRAGHARHARLGETPCAACRQAQRDYLNAYRNAN